MRIQPTRIEELNAEHPGLQLEVDKMLGQAALLADVQAMLQKNYGIAVSHQTLSKYKQKRWLPAVQRVRDRVERSQAIIEVIRKEGDTDFARAYIFEQLDESARRGDRLNPAVALREQRMRMEIELRYRELELKAEEVKRIVTPGESKPKKSVEEALAHIREIFGLPPIRVGEDVVVETK